MSGHNDLGYKQLFAHREIVRDLLAGFTDLECFRQLELSSFERVNASYVSEQFAERHGDMVWKVQLGSQLLFVYLLLEFQSQPERWMALRMQVYVGLLYQDLLKRGALADAGRLPPVLPLVFYNGKMPWNASDELRSLVASAPDELACFQASQRYLLIDQNRIESRQLAHAMNLVAFLFSFELSVPPSVLINVFNTLLGWLAGVERAPLRRSIDAWLRMLQLREAGTIFFDGVEQLLEDEAMGERFQRNYASWADYHVEQGRQQGRQQGREEGREEGMTQAMRHMLRRQLQHRFASVPDSLMAMIDQASAAHLERWLDRVLDAPDVEVVFSD
jgi:predicted transposase YdaD